VADRVNSLVRTNHAFTGDARVGMINRMMISAVERLHINPFDGTMLPRHPLGAWAVYGGQDF
jgi:hypothetical protein